MPAWWGQRKRPRFDPWRGQCCVPLDDKGPCVKMVAAANRPHAVGTVTSPNAIQLLRNEKVSDSKSEAGTFAAKRARMASTVHAGICWGRAVRLED